MGQRVDRIQSKQEHCSDRRSLLDWLCLGVLHCHLCAEGSHIDRKLLRLLTRLHQQVRQALKEGRQHLCLTGSRAIIQSCMVMMTSLRNTQLMLQAVSKEGLSAG